MDEKKKFLGVIINAALGILLSGGIVSAAVTLSQDISVGGGTPNVTLNGDDVYITGTFEVDGTSRFDSAMTLNANLNVNGFATTTAATGDLALAGLLTLNNYASGDPYILLQDLGTSKWFLGFDNSDGDKFRITPLAGSFSATSSGLTIELDGFVGIGTTGPNAKLEVAGGKTFVGTGTHTANNEMDVCLFGNSDCTAAQAGNFSSSLVLFGGGGQTRKITLEHVYNGGVFISSSFSDLTIRSTSNNASIILSPHGTGKVGIMTASPSHVLTVSGTSSASTTLAINNQNSGDSILALQTASTTRWVVGVDDSQAGDPFRIAPAGTHADIFSATSSGLTIGLDGFVGIGTTAPTAALEIGDGTDSVEFSTVGDITFVDADGAASITGPAGGALTVAAGASQALTLTGNLASTWSLSTGALTIASNDGSINLNLGGGAGDDLNVDSGTLIVESDNNRVGIGTNAPSHILTVSGTDSASTTLAIGNQNGGDSILAFKAASTTAWYIGVDDSDSDRFRVTAAQAFTATSSGISLDTAGRVGIGTTSPGEVFTVSTTNTTTTLQLDSTAASNQSVCILARSRDTGSIVYVTFTNTGIIVQTTNPGC